MTGSQGSQIGPRREAPEGARAVWALGDYHAFARATVWELGPVLVEACGVRPAQRVLDVAAGSGNTAIRAAERGAEVMASDITPENFEAGRREAHARGVELEWVEADAQALPFADGEFDVVTSSLGAVFAPDHQAAAGEMLRVCRPGGTLGMINFTPEGLGGDFFAIFTRHSPSPEAAAPSPLLWGSEPHVRALFGERVARLELTRRSYVETCADPESYTELFASAFGPVIALRSALAGQPSRLAALDSDLVEFATRSNSGPPAGPARYSYEYLLVVARRARD